MQGQSAQGSDSSTTASGVQMGDFYGGSNGGIYFPPFPTYKTPSAMMPELSPANIVMIGVGLFVVYKLVRKK